MDEKLALAELEADPREAVTTIVTALKALRAREQGRDDGEAEALIRAHAAVDRSRFGQALTRVLELLDEARGTTRRQPIRVGVGRVAD